MLKRTVLLFAFLAILSNAYSQIITIDSARSQDANGVSLLLGQTITVRGVVTTSREFGAPTVYFQVPSAGLVGYDATFGANVNRGDSVQVTGTVIQYNGLTELQPVSAYQVLATGITTPTPIVVTPGQIRTNGETYEARLIRINGISSIRSTSTYQPVTSWTVSGSGTNYRLFVGNDSCDIRINASSNIANTLIPSYPFSIVALNSQFKSGSPYIGGYQILPRDLSDIIITSGGPQISGIPMESNIAPTSVTISFTTISAGDTKVKYFLSDSLTEAVVYTDSAYNASQVTSHTITLNNLQPGKIYQALISSTNGSGTSTYSNKFFSTASHPSSTGKVEVYFNYPVDTSVALPNNKANGSTNFLTRLGQRIDSAQYSIDFCIYSFNEITTLKDKLINALIRGVKVRVVYDYRDGNIQALMQELINAGVRVQIRPYSTYLMHNKFFVFDGRDTSSSAHSRKWLWGGSANITNDQFYSDVQNVLFVQDESLCATYTREFEEMWGSHNDINNPGAGKFGAAKLDNTPHFFNINGKKWEIYFGPSDQAANRLVKLINDEPNKSINFAIYSFTLFTVANKMKAKYSPPTLMVRGVFDQANVSNNLYLEMKGIGGTSPWNPPAKVFLENYSGALLHSKYTVIDADLMTSSPVVETGSFNYSNAADQGNDENMMIIYDSLIANQYYQDFVKRLTDAGGTVDVQKITENVPLNYELRQNYPNPFNPSTKINFSVPKSAFVKISVFDILGREISVLVNKQLTSGVYSTEWNAASFPSGVYFYTLNADGVNISTGKMVLNK